MPQATTLTRKKQSVIDEPGQDPRLFSLRCDRVLNGKADLADAEIAIRNRTRPGGICSFRGEKMIETAWLMLLGSALLMLRVSPLSSFPRPLSKAEEQDCLERMAKGDREARNKLVEHDLRLVAHIVKKYYAQTDDIDDLISIGTIGLIKGIDSYDPAKGVKLSSYASRCIENEILMHFRGTRKRSADVSLSDALEGEEEGGLSILDVLAEDEDMTEHVMNAELCERLRYAIDKELSEREARILRLRYGLDGTAPLTQREVAERCKISRSYVSRIEKHALERLRSALEEDRSP